MDPREAVEFYASRQGGVAALLLRERLAAMWPDLSRQSILGIGYPMPYLRVWRDDAAACVAAVPAQLGVVSWPPGGPGLTCTAEEDALPFPDLCFDRILVVHALEAAEQAARLLRELWRVLRDDGRLLIVAPNRSGMWAHVESTPFGQGQPYSAGQVARLLGSSMFRVERRDTALYVPPTRLRLVLRSARIWEAAGRMVAPGLAGVTLAEAVKDQYSAMPTVALRRRRVALANSA